MNLKNARKKLKAGSVTILILKGFSVTTGKGNNSINHNVTSDLTVNAKKEGDYYYFFYKKRPYHIYHKLALKLGNAIIEHPVNLKNETYSWCKNREHFVKIANEGYNVEVKVQRKKKTDEYPIFVLSGKIQHVVKFMTDLMDYDFGGANSYIELHRK